MSGVIDFISHLNALKQKTNVNNKDHKSRISYRKKTSEPL